MDEEWENDNFEPKAIPSSATVPVHKWEGEDEDDEVKDNWEDEEEEEEKKDIEKQEPLKPVVKKGKKALLEKIEEKEQRKREKVEKQPKREELTSEEIQAEKLRQQKLQEESDLLVAMETFARKRGISTKVVATIRDVVLTFADRGCYVVNTTNPPAFYRCFSNQSRYLFIQVAPHLSEFDLVPNSLLQRKILEEVEIKTRTYGSIVRNFAHLTTGATL
uniref:Eukaryotic translation initiation factor 3 subunit J n=1 Tax=Timema shepardi TaxID=629360 RepID=A0A7R9AUX4_TIMSH|nr:unnamed protein product [Timema shepardi]